MSQCRAIPTTENDMQKHYFSFGQEHVHRYNDTTFDCDSIVQINAPNGSAARTKMFEVFGQKWAGHYSESDVNFKYFPRGVVIVLTCDEFTGKGE